MSKALNKMGQVVDAVADAVELLRDSPAFDRFVEWWNERPPVQRRRARRAARRERRRGADE